jgi:AraC family transcriptional regulator
MLEQPVGLLGLAQTDNDLIARLLGEALVLLEQDRTKARQRIEQAFALSRAPKGRDFVREKGVLPGWQLRKAVAFIQSELGTGLKIGDVARHVDLSKSYFSRAFKASVSVSYSEFVTRMRLDLAKHLLLTTDRPIAEIALLCGLSDQSHLTRLFSRSVGFPPRAWRRRLVKTALGQVPVEAH